ncbi:hypothetical protein QBC44DRAFT_53980 [Cladorrhinum sp. PSN332]|nr:hypothetical protein QBC44DRAFT_53980 [Cladorrhinum sp. PSN332]
MAKNRSITNFFKPVPKSSQSSSQLDPLPHLPRQSTPPPPPISKSPAKQLQSTPSLPETPSALRFLDSSPTKSPTPKPRARDAVIKASDDEDSDDDSDDEFPDLFRPVPASTLRKDPALLSTPRGNRISVDIYSSPSTVNTKRKKFNISTLLKHAEANNKINENTRIIDDMLKKSSSGGDSSLSSGKEPRKTLHESMMEIMSDPEDKDNQDEARAKKEKLLRAVKRIEADVGRRQWHFFKDHDEANSTSIEVRQSFPKARATGAWKFLAAEKGRSQAFEDGFPYRVQKRRNDLPDDIFIWVLKETVQEKSWKLRDGYLKLLSACPLQAGRMVDEDVVQQLFRNLGATEEALAPDAGTKKEYRAKGPDYLERDWTSLATVLRILSCTAAGLSIESLTRSMSLILRLGIDDVVREDPAVSRSYQDVLHSIVQAVPGRSWNDFCGEVSDSLYSHTSEASLRWNAVSSIPVLGPKLVELRRRLSLVFVFSEPQFARRKPEETFSMESVLQQINESDDFLIDRNHTDFYELRAMYDMLCVAVADGVKPSPGAGPSAIRQYDAEVDQTARRLKLLWSGIHEGGAAFESRLEAKAQLKDFERKLLHVVRSRPPRKENIFGIDEDREMREEKQFNASKNFMSNFLGNKQAAATTSKAP